MVFFLKKRFFYKDVALVFYFIGKKISIKSYKKSKTQRELEKLVSSINYDRLTGDKENGVTLWGIMKLISCNVCGMNSDSNRAVMKGVSHSFKGECLFIQETKMKNIGAQIIRSVCPWSNSLF